MTREQEVQAIEEAIKSGRIKRVPMWEDSGWDALPFRKRQATALNNAKKAKKLHMVDSKK